MKGVRVAAMLQGRYWTMFASNKLDIGLVGCNHVPSAMSIPVI